MKAVFKLQNGALVQRPKFEPTEQGDWVIGEVTEIDGIPVVDSTSMVTVDVRPRDWSRTAVKLLEKT